jgi:hypothetical protein
MTASQKAEFTRRTLLALLTAGADQAKLEKAIGALTRSLADAHGGPASYPPAGDAWSLRCLPVCRSHVGGFLLSGRDLGVLRFVLRQLAGSVGDPLEMQGN